MGGKGGGDQEVKQKIQPWKKARPYIGQALEGAQDQYENFRQQYYPGATVAPFAPAQMESQAYRQNYAQGVQPYINQAQNTSAFMQSPGMLDVASNPYVQGMAGAMGNRMSEMLTENALPAIRTGSIAAGQLGGSRQALAERGAIKDTQQKYGDALAGLYGGAYQSGLGAVNQAQALAPAMASLGAYPAQLMSGVGQEQRGYDQALINAAREPWQFYEQQPYDVMDRYFAQATGAGGLGSTQISTQPGPSTAQSALGGASLGLGAMHGLAGMTGGAVPGLAGLGGGYMAAAVPWALGGAVLGGLLG